MGLFQSARAREGARHLPAGLLFLRSRFNPRAPARARDRAAIRQAIFQTSFNPRAPARARDQARRLKTKPKKRFNPRAPARARDAATEEQWTAGVWFQSARAREGARPRLPRQKSSPTGFNPRAPARARDG